MKNQFKRFLSLLVAVVMVVSMMPTTTLASEESTQVTEVSTLDALNEALKIGGEIKLAADITYSGVYAEEWVNVPTGVTAVLDLNGHTLAQTTTRSGGTSMAAIVVRAGADLTVKDGVGTGKISACNSAFQLEGTLTLAGGSIVIGESASGADTDPETGFAYGVWMYMRSAGAAVPAFYMTGGSISMVDNGYVEDYVCALAMQAGVDGIDSCYDTAVVSITGGSLQGNVVVGLNAQNVTVTVAGVEVIRYGAAAKVGDDYFATLAEAVEAANAGDTVTALADITLTEGVVIAADDVITLDLNGKTVTGVPAVGEAFSVITNKGSLTVTNGAIVCDHQLGGSTAYAVNAITNSGTLTVDGATVENKSTSTNQIGYAIDNNSTSADAVLVINSGEVKASGSYYYDGIRLFCNSTENENSVTVNGGTVSSIWLQNPSDGSGQADTKDVKGSVTISGGEVTALYLEPSSAFEAEISDGYVGSVSYFTTSDGRDLTGFITGGSFGTNVSSTFVAAGCETVENTDGTYSVAKKTLSGSGTEEDPFLIKSLDELILFRDSVNNGETTYNASGVYVALAADIDMNNEEWEPIGIGDYSFLSNFDGKTYAIKNLSITNIAVDSDGYAYAGLFAITEGTAENQNIIQNLTIENVTINTTGHIVAAAVAYPYYTTLKNIVVKGDIDIDGGDYTSGVVAYTRRCTDASNLTISGNDDSAVTGGKTVGGVISDIQMNGGLTANYSNFTAENITVSGTMHVGGISGIISGQTLTTCAVKNVTLVCADDRVGIVSGSMGSPATVSDVTVENVTGASQIIGGTFSTGADMTAVIGSTYYATLTAAIEAAAEGDTVTLLQDITATEVIQIGKSVTIDGNDHTITSSDSRVIRITAANVNVTLNDLAMVSTAAWVYPGDIRGVSVDAVNGVTLTLNNCSVDFTDSSASDWSYAVNQSGEATSGNTIIINGGTYEGANVVNIWGQNHSVTIDGATLTSLYAANDKYHGVCVKINPNMSATVSVTNTTFNGDHAVAAEVANGEATLTACTDNTKVYVAKVGSAYYYTLAEAIKAAAEGDTVTLLTDVESSAVIGIEKSITLDLNGNKVTSTAKKAFEIYADATICNGTIVSVNRCVDTRKAVNLTLSKVTLIADDYTSAYGNPQPLTIGGYDDGTKVTMTEVTISAEDGYGIITFVKTELTATDSAVSGYNALYVKPGSDDSVFNFENCDLTGSTGTNDVEGNAFSTIAVRADNVTVTVDADSSVTATGNYCTAIVLGCGEEAETVTGAAVTVAGTVSGNMLAAETLTGNTVSVAAAYADMLTAEGYVVSDAVDGMITAESVAQASCNGVNYATLDEALTAAQTSGGTLTLLADCVSTNYFDVIPANTALDLNGCTLTVQNLWSFGDIIDGTVGGDGMIAVSGTANLDGTNTFLPLYDAENGGYRFYAYGLRARGVKTSGSGETLTFKYGFSVDFDNAEAYLLMQDAANSGLQLKVDLKWTDMPTGKTITYTVSDETVTEFAENAYKQIVEDEKGQTTYVVAVSVTGLSGLAAGTQVTATMNAYAAINVVSSGAAETATIEGE